MSGSVGPGPLQGGVSPPGDGGEWHILGHTYWNRAWSEATFAFETYDPPGTFVPPHVHPTQDEFIFVSEGQLEVELDGQRQPPRLLQHERRAHAVSLLGNAGREAQGALRPAARDDGHRAGRARVGRARRRVPPSRRRLTTRNGGRGASARGVGAGSPRVSIRSSTSSLPVWTNATASQSARASTEGRPRSAASCPS